MSGSPTICGVLAAIPHLEDAYDWRPPQSETYRFDADRLGTDVETLVQHYRENGAPHTWIEANRAQIADDLAQTYKEERADYLRRNPELVTPLTEAVRPGQGGAVEIVDRDRAAALVAALPDVDRGELWDAVGQDLVRRNPDLPHHVADHLTGLTVATRQALENDRLRAAGPNLPDAFAPFRARGAGEKDLTRDGPEHRELVRLIRENTTEDQYRRLERGDLTVVSHLTTDPIFARQLSREVDIAARGTGARYDPETEARIRDNREVLDRQFDRDSDYDRKR